MFRSRNLLLLLGVAVVAFAVFLWTGDRSDKEEAPNAVKRGASLMEGGRSAPAEAPSDQAAAEEERKKMVATLRARSRRALSGKPQESVDPELLERLPRGAGSLVPAGPPESPREGIVQQSFRGSGEILAGAPASTGDEGKQSAPQDAEDERAGDCRDCGAPSLKTTVADLSREPIMRAAYEKPCGADSLLIRAGFGERFTIGDAPACATYIPQTCRGSGVAIFDDRFVVSVHGECIPSLEYIKEVMRR